ncbi:putative ribosome biogenesis GTPase RsgA [Aliiroseovarius zhejiangensis]|uniref:Small ribosomal subunit biogenesis GTPase RsgA n=1 Tax=Aliiroseovarius zhejiangensis TaxID=1632025 RepID=A0ABQ3IZC5_9RHOB|nr:ribosome small subunit-dependent GTPase A [Aliiroseovarius zhejiangensis]GHE96476.1 putative ribosome biogenesis GTPase RsgA [Aliiroseovarius zhejiangensis]
MTYQLTDLGWSSFFQTQREAAPELTPYRITEIHRSRMTALGETGEATLTSPRLAAGELAVGDWVMVDPEMRIQQVLERKSLLQRRAAGTDAQTQLIASNVDTLFIVTSCNEDFNIARIERFLALAHEAGCYPVLVLTKADLCDDARAFEAEAQALDPMLTILTVNAREASAAEAVAAWCKPPQTAAFIGSSGVGKTTLTNALTGGDAATGGIREDDAKGRHVTTARSMHPMRNGGWIIDMPGMRALRLLDTREGIDSVFDDLAELEARCRFSDCAHDTEPGCAVRAAIEDGELDPERLQRWRKLRAGEAKNTETIAESRARERKFSKMVKGVVKGSGKRKGR